MTDKAKHIIKPAGASEFSDCCSIDWGIKVSALIDRELPPDEAVKTEEHLLSCEKCREFACQMRRLKGVMSEMKLADLPDARWKTYTAGIYNRIERGIGWLFASLGFVILMLCGGYYLFLDFFANTEIPILIRAGVGFIGIGLVVLIVAAVREAWFRFRTDRYKEVDL